MKTCTKCGTAKSLTDFGVNRRAKDGRRAKCRACRKVREKSPMSFEDYISKTCTKCGVTKTHAEFWKSSTGRGGLNPQCISCSREYKKALTAEADALNPKRAYSDKGIRCKSAPWVNMSHCNRCDSYKDLSEFRDNGDAPRYLCKSCSSEDHRKYNASPKGKAAQKAYYANNRGKVQSWARSYQIAKLKRVPCWTTPEMKKDIEVIYSQRVEMVKGTGNKFEVDHRIPLQGARVSGLHTPGNLQILTKSENSSKKNKFDVNQDWAFSVVTQQLEVIEDHVERENVSLSYSCGSV